MVKFSGCYTALITPMTRNQEIDYEGLQQIVEFQVKSSVAGILGVGTTGESPTLDWRDHSKVIEKIHEYSTGKSITIAGTGSNSTQETMDGTQHAYDAGVRAVLLVDPYYNGPSSIEIRKEYVEPIAQRFPEVQVIPYIIPGRTGTQMYPQDIAILHEKYPNVRSVKEATGDFKNMELTRQLCGDDFDILSGDDDKTLAMMTSPAIRACGAISVTANIAPTSVCTMMQNVLDGNLEAANAMVQKLQPLFNIITVKTQEQTPYGPVMCRARNPLAYKTLMNVMGMPAGPCRQPLGKMTRAGIEVVVAAARKVYETNPQILEPAAEFFDVKLSERLYDEKYLEGFYYA